MITIIALAVDPFSQQVVKYTSCPQAVDGLFPSVPVANNYSRTGSYGNLADVLDPQMASALYVGLVNAPANASAATRFTCDSGNCTFSNAQNDDTSATHMSLAMCGKCKDISTSIITTHYNQLIGSNMNGKTYVPAIRYGLPQPDSYPDYPGSGASNFSVSLAIQLPAIGYVTIPNSTNSMSYTTNPNITYSNWLALQSYAPNPYNNNLANFDAIMFRNCSCTGDWRAPTTTCVCEPLAASCGIFPCVKTYRAEITNFVLKETELSMQTLSEAKLFDYTLWTQKFLHRGKWVTCTNSTKPTLEHNVPVLITDTATADDYTYTQQGCVWVYEGAAGGVLGAALTSSGNLSGDNTFQTPAGASGDLWLENIFNNGNATIETLQNSISGLANSLTAVIRQYGNPIEGAQPLGSTWRAETCITVQWAWSSLPAALLLLAIMFLAITIWRTNTRQVVLWKSSPLALLFHGWNEDLKEKYGALGEVRDMEVAARSIGARVDQHT